MIKNPAEFAIVPKPKKGVLDVHVVVLNNFLGPHHCLVLKECVKRVRKLSILLSTPMEPNRAWLPEWEGLNVQIQKNWTVTRKWKHSNGFADENYVHIPWDTTKRLRELKPDVILSYEMGMRTLFSSVYRKRHPECVLGAIVNVSEETERCRGRLRPFLRRLLRNRIDLVTYNGPSCKRYLQQLGFKSEQLQHYPYCFDRRVAALPPKVFNDPISRLFYCGGLTQRKGIVPFCQRLCVWARRHPNRRLHLSLAGEGPLGEQIHNMDAPPNVHFDLLGAISPLEMSRHYGQADLTVLPTLADEWGLVVDESLASGTPVLGSCYSQAVQVRCREGENGWLFCPRDQKETDTAIERALATSTANLYGMSQAARQSVAHVTAGYGADKFHHLVEKAIKLRGRSG